MDQHRLPTGATVPVCVCLLELLVLPGLPRREGRQRRTKDGCVKESRGHAHTPYTVGERSRRLSRRGPCVVDGGQSMRCGLEDLILAFMYTVWIGRGVNWTVRSLPPSMDGWMDGWIHF